MAGHSRAARPRGHQLFRLCFFLVSFSSSFFQSPCKRPKISHNSVQPGSTIVEGCNWEGVAPGPAAPVPPPEAVSKLAFKASVRDLRFQTWFVSAPATFTISSHGGRKYLQVKRNVLKSCLTSGTVLMLTPFSPHIRATSRTSFTIVPFHLAHVSLTANQVRSSRILSPPLFRSASPMVLSPCGERWENAHLRIWLCH